MQQIIINGNLQPVLPVKLGDVSIYRELDILSIVSDTLFSLHCNVQFDICWFDVSGWYFARTAGLLGTLNNEPYDEYTMANSRITNGTKEFTDSWSLQHCSTRDSTLQHFSGKAVETCNSFFHSGMLSACSAVVEPEPFYAMCLDLVMNSQPIRPDHPAVKGACAAALAYMEACSTLKVPLRVPDQCVL